MRYVSQLFQPLITIPKNAKIKNTEITCKSQKLLLECGLVRPTSSGLFSLLPLARRAIDKLEALVRHHIEAAGAQRVSLPALTSSRLWERSGRLDGVGPELLKVTDRHEKPYLLAPTHEEAIADLLADTGPLSYKQLPLLLYQISNKYRDEHRPKHGLLRAREFSMLDAYAAHAHHATDGVYARAGGQYAAMFRRLRLPVHRVEAPSGDMGGTLSHEWQLVAAAGEDAIDICPSCSHAQLAGDRNTCGKCGKETNRFSSIEVGHTFVLGTRYSDPLKAHYVPAEGPSQPLVMSCYGLGITRLLAASLEALSSDNCMRWPDIIAPYSTIVIGPKEGSKEWSHHGWNEILNVQSRLSSVEELKDDVIVDDRHNLTIGKRLMMADRIGYPNIIVCGKSTLDSPPKYEVYRSKPHQESTPELMTIDEIVDRFSNRQVEDDRDKLLKYNE